ncbi:MAG: NAD(P)-binding protein, partial [Deltaproteobacteria bacterium]|nr:NAD(P)-binding protein [Deltaproteobacteria bacterium]
MSAQHKMKDSIPLFVPHSFRTTESNKTGSWRFLRPRYDEKTAPFVPCQPAGEDIGRIEMLTARGLFKEAWETILKENPLPAACGRVCLRPCEKECNRREFDEGIGIRTMERFLADTAARYELKPSLERLSSQNRKMAVVGAGPAGLAAAYFLTRLGYGCDVFESAPEPGGVLRYGIPAYRLPVGVLRAEIEQICGTGFNLYCQKPVTKAFLEEIQSEYDAVFLGCGRSRGVALHIAGEEAGGVEDGLQFLQKVNRGEAPSFFNAQVAVIGGGNTAV